MVHLVKQLDRRRLLRLLTAVHHDYPVRAPGDDPHVVGNQQHRHLEFAAQVVQNVQDLGLNRHVEGRCGLVGDQQFGRARESHRDDHALAKTAGELEGILVQSLGRPGHVNHLEDFQRALAASSSVTPR